MVNLVTVDIQGFCIPEFYPKEISFTNGLQTAHYLIKPLVPYGTLSCNVKKQIRYLENNHHGLKYSSGYVSDNDLNEILRNHLLDSAVHIVYVKGHQKQEFLEQKLYDLGGTSTPSVINVEHLDISVEEVPNFFKNLPLCLYHSNNNNNSNYMCSLRNSKKLYDWLYSNLPK